MSGGESSRGGSRGRGHRGRGRGRPFWLNKRPDKPVLSEKDIDYESIIIPDLPSPYSGWKHYFPDEVYNQSSPTAAKILKAIAFFDQMKSSLNLKELEVKRYFNLNVSRLLEDVSFMEDWPLVYEDLRDSPNQTLNCLSLALYQVASSLKPSGSDFELSPVRLRIIGFEPVVSLRNVRAKVFEKLVTVKGVVIRVGPSRLLCISMAFICSFCRFPFTIHLKDGIFSKPESCPGGGCKSKNFIPLCSSHFTKTVNYQIIKVQESIGGGDQKEAGGQVPRTIDVEFIDDLVDSCCPGDDVLITGVVKANHGKSAKKTANIFKLSLQGVSLVNTKSAGRNQNNIEFSLKDYYAIQELYAEEQLWRLLVNSLCPTIYGHELVKAGLLLAMVGGSESTSEDPCTKRSLIHVLIVGDPGLGKSHMLHACASVAPRGVYVCGSSTTSSGLTVTLNKESGDHFALEAGALIIANHGICCIDEFDKMKNQHQALLEAMEQERLSVAKAGVVCSLPAHTSIIAAANPVGGHYNRHKSVLENLRMSAPLLSRFDLIFIIVDKPNEETDSLLSEHVMAIRTGAKRKNPFSDRSVSSSVHSQPQPTSLPDRLKLRSGEEIELVPKKLLRKYITYVKKYVPSPKLTPEACQVLQEFYLQLRAEYQPNKSAPVTTRQLESMIRLTQARAKIELREEATEEDAKDVVELMRHALVDVYQATDSKTPRHASQASRAKSFIAGLKKRAQIDNKNIFSMEEMKDLCRLLKIEVPDFISFVDSLNNQGFLLKRPFNKYQLLTV